MRRATGRRSMRTREMKPRLITAILAAVAVAALLVAVPGCGDTSAGAPDEIIRKAITAQENLKSVHMELDSELDLDVPGGHRSSVISYKGVFEQPDRWRLTVRSEGRKSEVVIIGDTAYVKLQGAETWDEKKGGEYVEAGSPPGDVVGLQYLDSATEVRMLDEKGDTYHLGFDLDMERYAREFNVPGVNLSQLEGKQAKMEVRVLKDSMFIEKATLSFSGNMGADSGNVKMLIESLFSEFNEPVTIEPPI